jgi:hypothetical protein
VALGEGGEEGLVEIGKGSCGHENGPGSRTGAAAEAPGPVLKGTRVQISCLTTLSTLRTLGIVQL